MKETQVMIVPSFDGYSLQRKLTLPEGRNEISKSIVLVHGTGVNTYENSDIIEGTDVSMFETLTDEFLKRGIALFSYNQRRIHLSHNLPLFYYMNVIENWRTYAAIFH